MLDPTVYWLALLREIFLGVASTYRSPLAPSSEVAPADLIPAVTFHQSEGGGVDGDGQEVVMTVQCWAESEDGAWALYRRLNDALLGEGTTGMRSAGGQTLTGIRLGEGGDPLAVQDEESLLYFVSVDFCYGMALDG